MYCLEAVLAGEPVLRALADGLPKARVVLLDQHLSLLPMTDAVAEAMAVAGAPELDGFFKAPAGLGGVLAACSVRGPVAYVEADFFGGVGTQSAQVWHGGQTVLGPLHMSEAQQPPAEGSPISRALRRLGVVRGGGFDEFDAVGLGRHRETDDWR